MFILCSCFLFQQSVLSIIWMPSEKIFGWVRDFRFLVDAGPAEFRPQPEDVLPVITTALGWQWDETPIKFFVKRALSHADGNVGSLEKLEQEAVVVPNQVGDITPLC